MSLPRNTVLGVSMTIVGLAVGYLFGKHTANADVQTNSPAKEVRGSLAKSDAAMPRVASSPDPRPAEAASGTPDTASGLSTVQRLNLIAELKREKIASFNIQLLTREGRISPGMIQLLDLTRPEIDAIQKAIDATKSTIKENAINNASLISADSNSVVVSTPPFEKGGELYDSFTSALETTLGRERFSAFIASQSDSLFREMNSYGAEKMTYTVMRIPNTERYHITESKDVGPGQKPAPGNTVVIRDPTKLPANYAWLSRYSQQLAALQRKAN